jgi:hypothetical protein
MRIRQIALVARDLAPAVETLEQVLGVEVCFRDPGVGVFGLENALVSIGDTFLEVVSPVRDDASAARLLARRGGDGGYMVILQCEELEKHRRRVEELSVRVVWETALEDIATVHLHPRDVGGAIVSLDEARPPESWRWAGRRWEEKVHTEVVRGIVGAELQSADPAALAARWSQVLACPARGVGDAHEIVPGTRGRRRARDRARRRAAALRGGHGWSRRGAFGHRARGGGPRAAGRGRRGAGAAGGRGRRPDLRDAGATARHLRLEILGASSRSSLSPRCTTASGRGRRSRR